MNHHRSIILFIIGILIIFLSPFITDAIFKIAYSNEPNFLDVRFSGFLSAIRLIGSLISAFGIVMFMCDIFKKQNE